MNNTNPPRLSPSDLWARMDPMERSLRERKLVAMSLGPAVVALFILVPIVNLYVGVGVASVAFAATYIVSRKRLTKRLLAGQEN